MTLVTVQDLKKAGGLLSESVAIGPQVGHLLEALGDVKTMDQSAWLGLLVKGSATGFPEITDSEERGRLTGQSSQKERLLKWAMIRQTFCTISSVLSFSRSKARARPF